MAPFTALASGIFLTYKKQRALEANGSPAVYNDKNYNSGNENRNEFTGEFDCKNDVF